MAQIATYRCTDKLCRLTIHLSQEMPVWHPDTPRELRAITVSAQAEPYVARYRSEAYCHDCRTIQESSADNRCRRCARGTAPMEQAGLLCPQCKRGAFFIEHLIVR